MTHSMRKRIFIHDNTARHSRVEFLGRFSWTAPGAGYAIEDVHKDSSEVQECF